MKNRSKDLRVISPLNYAGNKTKVVKEIFDAVKFSENCFVDIFCGSAVVSVNSPCKKIVCNDIDKHTIEILKYFYNTNPKRIINDVYYFINKYNLTDSANKPAGFYKIYSHEGLSKYNKNGFNNLKQYYNQTHDVKALFPLAIFGFNHYLRFNSKDEYNVPVGKNDFYKLMQDRTLDFIKKMQSKDIIFYNVDFSDFKLYKFKNAIYYFDPPYLITNAPYNSFWNKKKEKQLLNLLDELNKRKIKFILSNVLQSNGKNNDILIKWIDRKSYSVKHLSRQYRNANYRRKNKSEADEIIVYNF